MITAIDGDIDCLSFSTIFNGRKGREKFLLYRWCQLVDQPSTDYAVKMVLGGQNAAVIMEEINIMRELDSPYCAGCIDWFKDSSFIYIVMDIYADDLVKAMLRKKTSTGKLDLRKNQIVRAVKQMLYGLEYCHSKNIIHCDVKADNYLLTEPVWVLT